MPVERLDKIISNAGYGTRKEVKAFCKEGRIKVNGVTQKDQGFHADPDKDEIEIDDERIIYRKYVYIMLNKPDGYISATEDNYDRTVMELLDAKYLHFEPAPVGRLDKDTEGLLLLTNDGELNHMLLSPKRHVNKKYFAKVDGFVNDEDKEAFLKGVTLDDGYETMPASLTILSAGEMSEIELVIQEGKFHQVKRMFEARGKKVVYLKRLEMGSLCLDENLKTGESRELYEDELMELLKLSGLKR